ncbi:acetyltransferase [Hymenobacter sp. UYP22]|uniref:acetyltransferase n=1 Tax=Hymenobacter sp. UYP22 TaxID=3156348 RepID=UPI003397CA3C
MQPASTFSKALRPLAIVGAGGLGREVLLLVRQINAQQPTWEVTGFYDDQVPAQPTIHGIPYRGTVADLNSSPQPLHAIIAVGSSRSRQAIASRLTSAHVQFATLVHPGVARADYQHLTIGAGSVICQGCILTCDITLGQHVLLNLGCTIGHDAVLDDFCSLMPHANVGGEAHLETGVYLGTNATVINQVRVGTATIVGAGAVVVRNLPGNCTAVGVPARTVQAQRQP